MKQILNLWRLDLKACLMMIIKSVIDLVDAVVDGVILLQVSNVFSNIDDLVFNIIVLLALCVGNLVLETISTMLRTAGRRHVYRVLSKHCTSTLLEADYDLYSRYSCSYITTMWEYMDEVVDTGLMMSEFFIYVVNLLVTLICVGALCGFVVGLLIALYAICAIYLKFIMHKMTINAAEKNKLHKAQKQTVANMVNGFAEVRLFGRVPFYRDYTFAQSDKIYDVGFTRVKLKGELSIAFEMTDIIGMLIAILYTVSQIHVGNMTAALGVTLVLYVWKLNGPILNMLDISEEFIINIHKGKEFAGFLHDVENHKDLDGSVKFGGFHDCIEFKDVSFSYDGATTVIDQLNFCLKKGMRVGICGKSGNGKSTMFKLLNRFYKPQTGGIYIDGINLNDIESSSLRRMISAVPQENFILPSTILDNVKYGKEATQSEVEEACDKANLLEFIKSLPEGFNTDVGPNGLKLSGGQKQRIALARAFLMDTDVIFLDEATSSLDNGSETVIQDALQTLGKDKTIITIAHRLSTIKDSDLILVIDDHSIVESGTHEELIAKQGVYYAMQK